MLQGIDPVIVINLKTKIAKETGFSALVKNTVDSFLDLNVIPIYLSEKITGLIIDSEDKSIVSAIETTETETGQDIIKSRSVTSNLSLSIVGEETSLGIILMSSIMDVLYRKLHSLDYSIHYINKGISIFNAKLSSFNVSRDTGTTKFRISVELEYKTTEGLIEGASKTIEVSNAVPENQLTKVP